MPVAGGVLKTIAYIYGVRELLMYEAGRLMERKLLL
jgi:hypothetical protein